MQHNYNFCIKLIENISKYRKPMYIPLGARGVYAWCEVERVTTSEFDVYE